MIREAYEALTQRIVYRDALPSPIGGDQRTTYDRQCNIDDANLRINSARSELFQLIEPLIPGLIEKGHLA